MQPGRAGGCLRPLFGSGIALDEAAQRLEAAVHLDHERGVREREPVALSDEGRVAAPAPVLRPRADSGFDRVARDVAVTIQARGLAPDVALPARAPEGRGAARPSAFSSKSSSR